MSDLTVRYLILFSRSLPQKSSSGQPRIGVYLLRTTFATRVLYRLYTSSLPVYTTERLYSRAVTVLSELASIAFLDEREGTGCILYDEPRPIR